MPSLIVNGTELYYEIRGTGRPVLLIMGATGDGGHFDAFADALADEFMVISYDRRGNGRSPAPLGWATTSPQEQADDAVGLLTALGTGPVAVFGTSSGGNFALCLLIRHPGSVRGAILHDPGLYALAGDFDAVRAPLRALVHEAMQVGGPPAAVERFWCYVAGEDGWRRLAPALRQRLRATAGTLFEVELGTYELYWPGDEALAAIAAPVCLLVSEDGLSFWAEIAARFGQRLGVDVATTPGTHATYHEHPRELADNAAAVAARTVEVHPAVNQGEGGGRRAGLALGADDPAAGGDDAATGRGVAVHLAVDQGHPPVVHDAAAAGVAGRVVIDLGVGQDSRAPVGDAAGRDRRAAHRPGLGHRGGGVAAIGEWLRPLTS